MHLASRTSPPPSAPHDHNDDCASDDQYDYHDCADDDYNGVHHDYHGRHHNHDGTHHDYDGVHHDYRRDYDYYLVRSRASSVSPDEIKPKKPWGQPQGFLVPLV